jgi:hypothetical protein
MAQLHANKQHVANVLGENHAHGLHPPAKSSIIRIRQHNLTYIFGHHKILFVR